MSLSQADGAEYDLTGGAVNVSGSLKNMWELIAKHKTISWIVAGLILFAIDSLAIVAITGGEYYDPGAAAARIFILAVIVLVIRSGIRRMRGNSKKK